MLLLLPPPPQPLLLPLPLPLLLLPPPVPNPPRQTNNCGYHFINIYIRNYCKNFKYNTNTNAIYR